MLEESIITLARHRLKWLKVLVADRQAPSVKVQNAFYELTGLTSLRFVKDNGLPEKTRYELVLIDNLAILTVKHSHPDVLQFFSKETQNLAVYLDMPARELVDLIFKDGARFNNEEAVSVAIHRGLVENVNNEEQAYEKLASIEKRLEGKNIP
ncbi:hypothetical protein [uncultured Methylophaga sp.]|uniref:hypothetical protein n=1 Tax=uncultured Methylophaga sp. TaxID=285271 RepID=UPI0026349A3B|nr:hypothetical protein [uncultured Methylophaga sp.]